MKPLKFFSSIICIVLFSLSFSLSAKQIEVKGKITTFEKYPVNKVSITIKGTQSEVVSEEDGTFRIECDENDKLLIRANGFVTKKVSLAKLESKSALDLDLKLKDGDKNQELAMRFGHISEETLTHALEFVNTNLNYGSYAKITDILTEKNNRVKVTPYEVSIVGMKGKTLYMVDGSEVHFSYFESIPTTDIKTIAVLRNTASARYGMKGYGGVIEVTTKSN